MENTTIEFFEKIDGIGGFVVSLISQLYYATKNGFQYIIKIENSKNILINENFMNFDKLNIHHDISSPIIKSQYDLNFNIDDYFTTSLPKQIYDNINFGSYNKCLPNIINIGVHVRRGDVYYRSMCDDETRKKYYGSGPKSHARDNLKRRFIDNSIFVQIINYLNDLYGSDKVIFHIFSVGELSEFSEFDKIANKIMYISNPTYQETYYKIPDAIDETKILMSTLIHCDILVCSKSALSLSCALLSRGKQTIFPKWNNVKCSKWLNFNNYVEIKNKEI
jgi:hypothetical protein